MFANKLFPELKQTLPSPSLFKRGELKKSEYVEKGKDKPMKSEINKTAKKANETLHLPPPHPSLPKRGEGVSLLKTGVSWLKAGLTSLKQTLPTSLEKGGASRNQGKSKIEKQNKMKSKIKKHITLSSTTSPLSSQERGWGEFA